VTRVISVGGSLLAPDRIDVAFVRGFVAAVRRYVEQAPSHRAIVVCGGGMLARLYQKAYREIASAPSDESQDWVGIAATRVNAELVRQLLAEWCDDPVVTDPTAPIGFRGRVLVGAGWKPGFSTDNDAVLLAERFGAPEVINLSNIAQVYTADPKVDPDARPLDKVSWSEFRVITGDEWIPGKNSPFDPVATKRAAEAHLRVVFAAGGDLANFESILHDRPFVGTVIGPR
jgi:uridylate kinase